METVGGDSPKLLSGMEISVEEKINGQFYASDSKFFSLLTTVIQHKMLQDMYTLLTEQIHCRYHQSGMCPD